MTCLLDERINTGTWEHRPPLTPEGRKGKQNQTQCWRWENLSSSPVSDDIGLLKMCSKGMETRLLLLTLLSLLRQVNSQQEGLAWRLVSCLHIAQVRFCGILECLVRGAGLPSPS